MTIRCSGCIFWAMLPTDRPADSSLLRARAVLHGHRQSSQSECDSDLPGNAGQDAGCYSLGDSAANTNLGYLPNQQQFQALNFPQSEFLNQNYLNAVDIPAAGVSAVRLSAVEELRLCVFAAGEPQRGARSRRRLRAEPGLQLQWRTSPQPSDQRQYHSRRFDDGELRGGLLRRDCLQRRQYSVPASPFTVSGCNSAGGPAGTVSLRRCRR